MKDIVLTAAVDTTAKAPNLFVSMTNHNPKATKPTPTALPDEDADHEVAIWGHDNCFPITCARKIQKSSFAAGALHRNIQLMIGNNLAYCETNDEGKQPKRTYKPEVEMFLTENHIRTRYIPALFTDYKYFHACFSELSFDTSKKVTRLYHKSAAFCRLEKQNDKSLKIERLFYSAEYLEGTASKKATLKLINPVDPTFAIKDSKYAFYSYFPSPCMTYYPVAPWESLINDKSWLDVSITVPEIVSTMQQNQVDLKFQIVIPQSFFQMKFKDGQWDMMSEKDRQKVVGEVVDNLNTALSDPSNRYKSFTNIVDDTIPGQQRGQIQIIPIDNNKTKSGDWIPDSTTADAQITHAFTIHNSQIGLQNAGGKMGAGSGSDIRESHNTSLDLNTIDQQIALEALQYVSKINDWNIRFYIDHNYHTTTNNAESGIVQNDHSTQPKSE